MRTRRTAAKVKSPETAAASVRPATSNVGRSSGMGRWMRWQGYTVEQVATYEAYLDASLSGRVFTCLYPPRRAGRPARPVIAVRGGEARVVGFDIVRHVSQEEFDQTCKEFDVAAKAAGGRR